MAHTCRQWLEMMHSLKLRNAEIAGRALTMKMPARIALFWSASPIFEARTRWADAATLLPIGSRFTRSEGSKAGARRCEPAFAV